MMLGFLCHTVFSLCVCVCVFFIFEGKQTDKYSFTNIIERLDKFG